MANFVLLYNGGSFPESREAQTKFMQAWDAWYGHLGSAVVDRGHPFSHVAKSIAGDGTVSDGPAATIASGYSIIKANSLNEAAEEARNCPVLQNGAQISVYEALEVM